MGGHLMGTVAPETQKQTPNFWDLLSDADKRGYKTLKVALDASSGKRNRGHRMEAFDNVLEAIHRYAERRDENDWRRFLVCGVCWMDNMIAINTRQLRLLISKCKSSINGSFQKLGYTTNQSHTESWKYLFDRIPLLKDNFNELRQWTIRCRVPPTPQPILAYHDPQAIVDQSSHIQMQVQMPAFNTVRRQDSQPIQLNLLIPSGMINGQIPPGTVVSAQATPSPIRMVPAQPIAQVDPSIQFRAVQPIHQEQPPPLQPVQQPPVEPYCPLKFRTKLMHKQNSPGPND